MVSLNRDHLFVIYKDNLIYANVFLSVLSLFFPLSSPP